MKYRSTLPLRALALAVFLMLGCTSKSGSGSADPGAGDTAKGHGIGDKPYGIYKTTRYLNSLASCDQVAQIAEPPVYAVLYPIEQADTEPRLGGSFCGDLNLCRALAEQGQEPAMGYTFLTYDAQGAYWQGYGLSNTGRAEDQCKADVQSHVLAATGDGAIKVQTTTHEVIFAPTIDGETATCHNRAAIEAAGAEDLPCKALLVLEATYEAAL